MARRDGRLVLIRVIMLALSPLAPVGGHRHSRPPQAAILRALR